MPLTAADLRGTRRQKFNAKRTVVDGVSFASKKEAKRYGELKLLVMAKQIRNLRLQPRYALCPLILDIRALGNINDGTLSIRRLPVAEYVADFEYEELVGVIDFREAWKLTIEDAKGMKTAIYKLKKRWFEAQYGIRIRES